METAPNQLSCSELDFIHHTIPPTNCWDYFVENTDIDGNKYWGIDWNRDGVISPCSTQVRVAPNYHVVNHHCNPELGRFYAYREKFKLDTGHTFDVIAVRESTPDVARAFGCIYLVYIDKTSHTIVLLWSSHDFKTGCANDIMKEGCTT